MGPETKIPPKRAQLCTLNPMALAGGRDSETGVGGLDCAGGLASRTPGPIAASAAAPAAATFSCAAAAACRMLITGTMRQRKSAGVGQ